MFALKLIAALLAAASSVLSLDCTNGRQCVYMDACNKELKEGCPLAYSYKLDGDVLSMELAGFQPAGTGRYLAIGFNEEQKMSNARVTECSAIGNELKPSVKLSWNKDEGTVNLRIDDEENIRNDIISDPVSKYENGMIYCSWKQKVGAYTNDKVFQVKAGVKYHHLVAYGTTNDKPAPKLNKHDTAQYTIYDSFLPSVLNCEEGRTCVYMEACDGELKQGCPLAYSYKLDGEILSMELAGYQLSGTGRYLAIGFNEEKRMSNARVTECSSLGTEKLSVKLSWNRDVGTVNDRIDGEKDFRDQIITEPVAKYENGMIYCSWKQNVGPFDNPKVFQVQEGVKYQHLVSYGNTAVDKLTKHDDAEYTMSDYFIGGPDTGKGLNCGDGRTCVYMSECKDTFDAKCPLAYSFKLDGDILSMELIGYQKSGTKRYLAVGFSEESGMAGSKVTECSAIGDETVPTVKLSYNNYDPVNVRIDDEPNFRAQIISNAFTKYEDGIIYCSWKQNVKGLTGNDKVFQHKAGLKYHHICAYGPTAEDGSGLAVHENADSPLFADFENPDDPGEVSGKGLNCDGGRTCAYMKSCKGVLGTKCGLAYSFKLDGDILSMELAGYQQAGTDRYLAIGFNDKEGMGEAKVTECSAIGAETAPSVKLSYNTPGDLSVNVRIDDEENIRKSIISEAEGRYEDGMIYCKWKQNVSGIDGNDKVFKYTTGVVYQHICAYGPTAKDGSGLDHHDEYDSPMKTDFKGTEVTGDTTNTKLLKAHGSLMMIAWLICVPTAAVFARFLRAHWPTKKPFGLALWFHVHRTCNILACLVLIAGFVCVFIETNWQWRGVGSNSSYWVATHSTVGIIACVLAWMQPFISLLRCDPQNPRRPVFNWIHRLIGVTAFLLAVTAVSIAANNFTIWTDHLTYLILSFVPLGSVIVLFIIMTILDAKVRVHDANIVKIHAIRFTLVCIAIAVAAAAAISLVVMLILS